MDTPIGFKKKEHFFTVCNVYYKCVFNILPCSMQCNFLLHLDRNLALPEFLVIMSFGPQAGKTCVKYQAVMSDFDHNQMIVLQCNVIFLVSPY